MANRSTSHRLPEYSASQPASTVHRWLNDVSREGEQITHDAPWRIRITSAFDPRFMEEAPRGYVSMFEAIQRPCVTGKTKMDSNLRCMNLTCLIRAFSFLFCDHTARCCGHRHPHHPGVTDQTPRRAGSRLDEEATAARSHVANPDRVFETGSAVVMGLTCSPSMRACSIVHRHGAPVPGHSRAPRIVTVEPNFHRGWRHEGSRLLPALPAECSGEVKPASVAPRARCFLKSEVRARVSVPASSHHRQGSRPPSSRLTLVRGRGSAPPTVQAFRPKPARMPLGASPGTAAFAL